MESGVLLNGYNVFAPSAADAGGPFLHYLRRRLVQGAIVGILLFAILTVPAFPRIAHEYDCMDQQQGAPIGSGLDSGYKSYDYVYEGGGFMRAFGRHLTDCN